MPILWLAGILGLGGAFTLGYGSAKTTDKLLTYAIVAGAGFIAYKAVVKK